MVLPIYSYIYQKGSIKNYGSDTKQSLEWFNLYFIEDFYVHVVIFPFIHLFSAVQFCALSPPQNLQYSSKKSGGKKKLPFLSTGGKTRLSIADGAMDEVLD